MDWSLAIVALALLAVASCSGRIAGTPITPVMLFVAIGLLVGPRVLGEVDLSSGSSTVRTLAEASLALVLFVDASRVAPAQLRSEANTPVRLLGVGLPLTIIAGTAAAALIFDQMTIWEATVLAVILAPTDAALAQPVFGEKRIPERIREALNIESGLNDGICVPLLFAAVAAADIHSHISGGDHALKLLAEEIGYGVLAGVAAGALSAVIIRGAAARDWIASGWRPVVPVAGAVLAYGAATPLDGSGFIAAFVAGLAFRRFLGDDPSELNLFSEEVGTALSGATFLLFGAILLGPALGELSWEIVLYAVLSLTILRIVPVAIAMLGSGERASTIALLGWFGPRGLASIVFALIVIEESRLPEQQLIVVAAYLTVGLSVLLHGLSAAPLARRYASGTGGSPR